MTIPYTENLFSSVYKDDYRDSDNYHRVLFNSGRAVQARELTQLQTIIQKEIGRFGRNIFKEGAAVNPGGLTVNNAYEFIKLSLGAILPTNPSVLVGTTFTGETSGVKVIVLEVVAAGGADPVTLYVRYTDTSSGVSSANPIRMSSGENIDNGVYFYTVQSTNTLSNPAIGVGTRVSLGGGDFFVQGHFVYAIPQSKIISKYSSLASSDVGFKVIQDIVTTADNNDLYDNQGSTPNFSAPGADRYRIRLIIETRDNMDSDETFVYVAKVENGILVDEVKGLDDYNKINDLLALRTKEESGNYNVKPFIIQFEEDDSDDTVLNLKISDGISYINGYRAALGYPSTIQIPKAQDTIQINNEVVSANYGNYVVGTGGFGARDINVFEILNLRTVSNYGGATIGTARVRAVEEDGVNYRYSLFDITMNSGQSFRSVVSAGTSVTNYFNLVLENSKAVLKETGNNSLLFPLPKTRPSSLFDISLTTQRRFSTTTNPGGTATIALSSVGETFANTNQWFFSNADSAYTATPTVTGSGTAAATISSGPPSSSTFEILAYVNKAQAISRTKTLVETTVTDTVDSDGSGLLFIALGLPDIYEVTEIRRINSVGADISTSFTVDNGQRDNSYDLGRLILRSGQSAPSGNVYVKFKHFTHGVSGDFFSVNSYIGQVDYVDIPSYKQSNSVTVALRDVLDFRPVRNVSNTFSGGVSRINELPQNTNLIQMDVVYYQPRYSKLIINTNSELKIISGPSSLTPILPPTPADALHLYNIKLNPFTLNNTDMSIEKIETRRYTMADIGRLETRIDKLEELTTLSLLELDTANFDVLDSAGVNRTKSGFLVDNFKNHFFSDVDNTEYKASIDPDTKVLRPGFWTENIRLVYDSDLSTNTVLKGDNVYLKYTQVQQINQPLATTTENVNPFAVITHLGNIQLSPASDNWVEQRRRPARVVEGETIVLAANLDRNFNNWLWNWSGRTITNGALDESSVGSLSGTVSSTTQAGTITTTQTIREVIGDRIVDVTLIPFMRSIKVYFKAEGLRPNTQMFAFFDDVNVASWVRSEAYQNISGDPVDYGNIHFRATQHPETPSTLTTNNEGVIEGSFFIPSTEILSFRSGTREFTLLDITVNVPANSTSIARNLFTSAGAIRTSQADVLTTRRILTTVNTDLGRTQRLRDGRDPLAQSFFVEGPNGIYLTKVDLYFATKDAAIPVQVQIRPIVNGHPSSTDIIPGSIKFLAPSSVNISSNATAITSFEFDEPLFLAPSTEYAIVILAESTDYNVFVAEISEFLIGSTERRVTLQPTMGSLFKSQNGSTWEPDQTKDLTFRLWRADFTSLSGTAILENVSVPKRLLDIDPIMVDSGSSSITIIHPNHGFSIGDEVTLSLDSSADIGGINGTSILGVNTITTVDWTGYKITADSAATSNAIGGGDVLASQNILFDIFVPSIETLIPNETNVSFSAQFTSSKSLAGIETPYQKSSFAIDIFPFQNNILSSPRLIANEENEISELGADVKSATISVAMSSNSSKVSPMIDMQRASLFLINNIIDNQDSASSTGFNIPLNFVPETDPGEGSSIAKHITKVITLEEDAVGIKVLIAANRPSVAQMRVFYRTASGTGITDTPWAEASVDRAIPSDENTSIFREYQYLIGGQGGALTPFTQFQIKVVFTSTNSSKVPVLRDLRVIALGV